MARKSRLDQSFSRSLIIRRLTGKPEGKIDLSTLVISPSGEIQPAPASSSEDAAPEAPRTPKNEHSS